MTLHSPEVGIPAQDEIPCKGTAIQCRITTEDPKITSCLIQVKSWHIVAPVALVSA